MTEQLRILHLEDSAEDSEIIAAQLRQAGLTFELRRVETREAFTAALDGFRPDIVLADFKLPRFDGRSALDLVRQDHPALPVIMVTGALGEEEATALLVAGAADYLLKDRLQRLGTAVRRAVSEAKEVRERIAAEIALRESEERFRLVVEHAPEAIFIEADGRFLYVNPAAQSLFGAHSTSDLVGKPISGRVLAKDPLLPEALAKSRDDRGGTASSREEIYIRLDGSPVEVEVSITPFNYGGDAGRLVFANDITKRKIAESKVTFLAYHDRLTELPNRELFYDRLSQAISQRRRRNGRLALLFLDLDEFKAVNDRYGHEAGDALLKGVAVRLVDSVRAVDTVARLGGDEFAIILPEIALPMDAAKVAEKVIGEIQAPFLLQDIGPLTVGVSVGIAISPEGGDEIDRLLGAADRAMYHSKSGGKNRYSFFDGKMPEAAQDLRWIVLDGALMTGIAELDDQHLEIARQLNSLNDALKRDLPQATTTPMMDAIVAYTRSHFATEERLMREHAYPDEAGHIAAHRALEAEAGHLLFRLIDGRELAVLQMLKDWLLNHIQQLDKPLAEFLSQRGHA